MTALGRGLGVLRETVTRQDQAKRGLTSQVMETSLAHGEHDTVYQVATEPTWSCIVRERPHEGLFLASSQNTTGGHGGIKTKAPGGVFRSPTGDVDPHAGDESPGYGPKVDPAPTPGPAIAREQGNPSILLPSDQTRYACFVQRFWSLLQMGEDQELTVFFT